MTALNQFFASLILIISIFSTIQAQSDSAPRISSEYQSEIETLIQKSNISEALKRIEEYDDLTIRNQIELTEIEAPPYKEHKFGRGERFADLLKTYGADSVWVDSIGNVIALRKGTVREKVLVVAGHLDTVFPEGTDVKVRKSNDTLYAPGIGDDGRGLAAVLTILKVLKDTRLRTKNDILFVGNVF